MDETAAQANASQLQNQVEENTALSRELKTRIKSLEKQREGGREGQIRKQQVRNRGCNVTPWKSHLNYRGGPDGSSKIEIRGGDPGLPKCRAGLPKEIQAEDGKAV